MADSALWVAALTGGTAVLASWVTNLGNVRAARAQAEASASAQRSVRVRELRRAAYLELMEQSHLTGQIYRRVVDAQFQLTEREPLLARIQELRMELREAYASLMRSVLVIALEGPSATAAAAEALLEAARQTNRALWLMSLEEHDARARFDEANSGFTRCLERFVEAARAAMEVP